MLKDPLQQQSPIPDAAQQPSMSVEYLEALRDEAELGNADALIRMGLFHLTAEGRGGQEAVRCLQAAAEQGTVTAQFYLGTLFDEGRHVSRDPAQADAWFGKLFEQLSAQHQGTGTMEPEHAMLLARLYEMGAGTPKDNKKAMAHLYELAAKQGYTPAQHGLAWRYLGAGQSAEARKWLERAAKAGRASAQRDLGELHLEQGDPVRAEAWLKSAAEQGDSRAREVLRERKGNGQQESQADELLPDDEMGGPCGN